MLIYSQSSRLVPPVDGRDITGEVNPSDHGDGPILVSVPGMPSEIDDRVFTTSKESGLDSEFPFNPDWQSGNAVGVGTCSRSLAVRVLHEIIIS